MPTSPPTVRGHVADITINGVEYELYKAPNRKPALPGRFVSAQPVGPGPGAEAIRLMEDASGGGGYGRRLIPNGISHGEGVVTRFQDVVFLGPQVNEVVLPNGVGAIVGSFELDWETGHEDLFLLAGRYALMVRDGRGNPIQHNDFGAGVTALSGKASASGPAYVGTTGRIWQMGGTTPPWTQSSDASFRHLAQIYWTNGGGVGALAGDGSGGVGNFRLIGTDTTAAGFRYVIATNLGPSPLTNANWKPSAYIPVGNSAYPILKLIEANRAVFFLKKNGVHMVMGDGYSPNLTPHWEQQNSPWAGIAGCVYGTGSGAHLYVAGPHCLERVPMDGRMDRDGPEPCGPGDPPLPDESNQNGHVTEVIVEGNWLVAAKYNVADDKSRIYWGRERRPGEDGFGPLVWGAAEIVLDGKVTHMNVSSLTNSAADPQSRLWIHTLDGSTAHTYWVGLPAGGNPLQDPNCRFRSEGSLYWGLDDGGQGNSWTRKAIRRIDQYADKMTESGGTVSPYINTDGGSYARVGTMRGTARRSFRRTGQAVGTMMGVRTDLTTENPAYTPILRSTSLHVIMLPEQVRQKDFQILVKDGGRQTAFFVRQDLEALQESTDVEVIWQGRRYSAKILPGVAEGEEPDVNGKDMHSVVNVRIDFLYRKWKWNDGTKWNGGEQWG